MYLKTPKSHIHQTYPTRSFYDLIEPKSLTSGIIPVDFVPVEHPKVAHLVVQIDPMPVLGERTRPCRKESPLAQRPLAQSVFEGRCWV